MANFTEKPLATATSKDAERETPAASSVVHDTSRKPLSKKVLRVIWDSLDKDPKERALVTKLDWWILSYICIAYFVKYLDQTNVSNAYVSGMKEDLKMAGNDLNWLTTYWTIGYILGNIPSQLILTKVRPSIWLPTLELIWSVLVMGIAGAKNLKTVYTLRFFIGLLEASAYPGIMTLLGTWYTPYELGKRVCIFQVSSSAAQMFSGYLQAGLYSGMNGRDGIAAWQWLFIFDGIIGIPIALYGYWAIPDSPTDTKAKWLKPEQRDLAVTRMQNCGRVPRKKLTWQVVREVFTQWPVYAFSATFICHVLGIKVYSYFNIYLKATKRFSVEQVNVIPTGGYGLQIVFTLLYAWTSDAIARRWPVILFAAGVAVIGCIILSVWPSQNIHAMLAGWLLTFCETGAGALIMAWINEICSFSTEHRLLVIAVTETMAFVFQAWVPLYVYNTGQAPHFKIGYEMALMFFGLEAVFTLVIWQLWKRAPPNSEVKDDHHGAASVSEVLAQPTV